MKKIIIYVSAIIAFAGVGCNTTNNSDPRSVLMSFMDALGRKDIEGAKKFATKDSEAMLGMIQMGMGMAPDSSKTKTYVKDNMDFGNAIITGDKATVAVKDKKSGETINYTLKKESGAWKVAFDKATMMDIGKEKMREHGVDGNRMIDSASQMMNGLKDMQNDSSRSMQQQDSAY